MAALLGCFFRIFGHEEAGLIVQGGCWGPAYGISSLDPFSRVSVVVEISFFPIWAGRCGFVETAGECTCSLHDLTVGPMRPLSSDLDWRTKCSEFATQSGFRIEINRHKIEC